MFKNIPQFLHMLKAEEEGLINIVIEVMDTEVQQFTGTLVRCVRSMDYGEISSAWNELREEICQDVVQNHLVPAAAKWVKEHLRGKAEEFVAERCRMELEFVSHLLPSRERLTLVQRVNVRPFATPRMEQGETPSVLALTNGKGDLRDAVMAVMLDDDGNIRTQTKFDNLKDQGDRSSFLELIERRTPQVIVVGGMSVQTGKLRDDVAASLREYAIRTAGENPPVQDAYGSHEEFVAALADFDQRIAPSLIPLVFVSDATARIYMMSEEAEKEHPTLPMNGRYALALARYTQNPLNAYCKLGRQIASVTFMEHHQKLVRATSTLHWLG